MSSHPIGANIAECRRTRPPSPAPAVSPAPPAERRVPDVGPWWATVHSRDRRPVHAIGTFIGCDDHRSLQIIAEHIDGEVGTIDVERTTQRLAGYLATGELTIEVIAGQRHGDASDVRLFELQFDDGLEPIRIPVQPLTHMPRPHLAARVRALRAAGHTW